MLICIKALYTNRMLFHKRPRNAEGSVWIRNVRRDSTQLTSLLHVTWLTRILDTLPSQISVLSCLLFIRGLGMQRAAYEGAMCDMILHNRHASVMWHASHIATWSIATWSIPTWYIATWSVCACVYVCMCVYVCACMRVCMCVYVCMWVMWQDSHIATWFLATWYTLRHDSGQQTSRIHVTWHNSCLSSTPCPHRSQDCHFDLGPILRCLQTSALHVT